LNRSRPRLLLAFTVLTAAWLTACQSAPTRIYTLYAVAPVAPREPYTGPALRIDAVHFPPALDRIEIVRDIAPGEMSLSDLDHWSAPLGEAARQALSADLVQRLPSGKAIFPHLNKPDGALGVAVDVLEFKADHDGALLVASWVVSAAGQPAASNPATATLRTDTPSGNAAATAQALSALLAQLADRIVDGL
jgi:uncharacterized lipoprotein YmbA